MKPFSLLSLGLSLGLALSLSTFAHAQLVAGIEKTEVSKAMELQPNLESPAVELVEAEALGCLAKGRASATYDRRTKSVSFAFQMRNLDAKRTLFAGFVVRSIYTRPGMSYGPEVDSAAYRVRLEPGETKTFHGQLAWDAPEGAVARIVFPDPIVHPESILRAQFEATPVETAQAEPAGDAIEATPSLLERRAYNALVIGRESVTWNRGARTVSFSIVLRNTNKEQALEVGVLVKTMSTRPLNESGPETDSMGFRARIPAGESRVIRGTLAWDDLGGLAVPRLALPDKELHAEQILMAKLESLEKAP